MPRKKIIKITTEDLILEHLESSREALSRIESKADANKDHVAEIDKKLIDVKHEIKSIKEEDSRQNDLLKEHIEGVKQNRESIMEMQKPNKYEITIKTLKSFIIQFGWVAGAIYAIIRLVEGRF